MRSFGLFLAAAAVISIATPALSADLSVRREAGVAPAYEARPVACLRWVPQNHAWYNYCDAIPYAPRLKYPVWTDLFGG
jgi:hypothetical protein